MADKTHATPDDNPTLNEALKRLSDGQSVFPLIPNDKRPLVDWKRYQTELIAEAELRETFRENPGANYGTPTGKHNNLTVVDLDGKHAPKLLKDHAEKHGVSIPKTLTVKTPHGHHLHLQHNDCVKNGVALLTAGPECDCQRDGKPHKCHVDTRGEGGFVVAPGSVVAGKTYRVTKDVPVADGHALLLSLAKLRATSRATTADGDGKAGGLDTAAVLAGVPQGKRDDAVWSLAGKLRNTDVPLGMAIELMQTAAGNCTPPFSLALAEEKVRRAYRTYPPGGVPEEPEEPSRDFGPQDAHLRWQTVGELLDEPEPEIEWVYDRMLPVDGSSILVSRPKVGKSTFGRNLTIAVARGEPFLDRATTQGPVVYVAVGEESKRRVRSQFRRMGATKDDPIHVHVGQASDNLISELEAKIVETGAVLAVVNPLFKGVRILQGNDYAEVTRALVPLIQLAHRTGVHLMCEHHAGKGNREAVSSPLGSTALAGAVDTVLVLSKKEQGRTLQTIQREGEDLEPLLLTIDPDTELISAGGTLAEAEEQKARETIVAFVDAHGDTGVTLNQIRELSGVRTVLVSPALRHLMAVGKLRREGKGVSGDPHMYFPVFAFPPLPENARTRNPELERPASRSDKETGRERDLRPPEASSAREPAAPGGLRRRVAEIAKEKGKAKPPARSRQSAPAQTDSPSFEGWADDMHASDADHWAGFSGGADRAANGGVEVDA